MQILKHGEGINALKRIDSALILRYNEQIKNKMNPISQQQQTPLEKASSSPRRENSAPLAQVENEASTISNLETKKEKDPIFLNDSPVSTTFFRFMTGFGSGLAGTIVLGLIVFLTWSIVGDVLSPSDVQETAFGIQLKRDGAHPLFIYAVILGIFLANLAANIALTFVSSLVEEKYAARSTAITQIFAGSLLLLFFFLPVYLVGNGFYGSSGIAFAGLFHSMCLAIFTFFAMEVIAGTRYILVNLYGIILGITLFFFFGIMFSGHPAITIFLTLPLLFGFLGAGNGIAEGVYNWFFHTYGSDFLNLEKRYGDDYGKNEVEADEIDNDL